MKILSWWIKHSLILIIFLSIAYATGASDMEAPWGTWGQTFLIALSPVGAVVGYILVLAIKFFINIFFKK